MGNAGEASLASHPPEGVSVSDLNLIIGQVSSLDRVYTFREQSRSIVQCRIVPFWFKSTLLLKRFLSFPTIQTVFSDCMIDVLLLTKI